MWFAYVDNSILWYDLSIKEVKELISINKRGEKTLSLEDYKNQCLSTPIHKDLDLIQENNIDRFEKKKNSPKKHHNRGKSTKEKQENNHQVVNQKSQHITDIPQKYRNQKNHHKKTNDTRKKSQPPKNENGHE